MMTKRIGSTDTTNDKQPIILATLRDIEKAKIKYGPVIAFLNFWIGKISFYFRLFILYQ
jgi:hypothetical protein